MTNREPDELDHWLRRGLEPDVDAPPRVAGRALGRAGAAPGRRPRRGPTRALLAVPLFAALAVAVALWAGRDGGHPPDRAQPVRIANHGELVTLVDAAGSVWLQSPPRPVADAAPHLIITMGDSDVD